MYSKRGEEEGINTKRVRPLEDHFKEYILQDGKIKKVTAPPGIGQLNTTTGSFRPTGAIIHLKNDAFPEPIDNIHTFRIKLPCPNVVNFVPMSDDDYLILPRIKSTECRVIHKTTAMGLPGNEIICGSIRPKNVGVWFSTNPLSEKMRINPTFFCKDPEDIVIKYEPNGFRLFTNTCQKVSLMDDQDMAALGVVDNTVANARANLEKIGNVFNVRPSRTTNIGGTAAGVHIFHVSDNSSPEPEFLTDEVWNKDTGQLYSDSCFFHVWLAEGLIDENTTIWWSIDWTLEKVTGKELVYYQNREEQRAKLIESGAYIDEKIKEYKDKQQLVYTVKGYDDDMVYLWKSYLTNGNLVPYLAPGICARDKDELEVNNITHLTYDPNEPYKIGSVKLPDQTLAEFLGPAMNAVTAATLKAKKGVAFDEDTFSRETFLYEKNQKLVTDDNTDGPSGTVDLVDGPSDGLDEM